MASQNIPIRAAAFTFEVSGFYSQADPTIFQVAPTIAAGDFWISKDGGGWNALTNTPTVITAGSVDTMVQFVLTATEMTADRVAVKWVDAAGAEWIAGAVTFYTAAVGADALARTTDVSAVETDTQDIQSRLPAALTANGNIKASLVEILTTALTETAGQIAAAFKQFFNIATPASTMDALVSVATATNLTNAPTNGDLTAAMKASVNAEADAALTDYDGPTNAELATALGTADDAVLTQLGLVKAKTDLIPASPAAVGDPMTLEVDAVDNLALATTAAAEIADKLLGRTPRGGADHATYNVGRSLGRVGNRVVLDVGTLTATVYQEDGTTPWFTFAFVLASRDALTEQS